MKPRHLVSAAVTVVTAVLAVGFVTAQPEAVQTQPGQRVRIINRQLAQDADANGPIIMISTLPQDYAAAGDVMFFTTALPAVPGVATPGQPLTVPVVGFRGLSSASNAGVPMNQFMKVMGVNDDLYFSFSFTDTPLPMILGPLADMSSGIAPPPAPVVQAGQPVNGFATSVIRAMPATATFAMPLSPKLSFEYEDAVDRLVTVSGENLTLEEALELISVESGCDIFQDGDNVVVNWCED